MDPFWERSQEAVANAVARYEGLLGISLNDLKPRTLRGTGRDTQDTDDESHDDSLTPGMHDVATGEDRFAVHTYVQHMGGLAVFGTELRFLVANRKGYPVTYISGKLKPSLAGTRSKARPMRRIQGAGVAEVADVPAIVRAAAQQVVGAELTRFSPVAAVIWAGRAGDDRAPIEALELEAANDAQGGSAFPHVWRMVADPVTGEILYKQSLVSLAVSGTVTAVVSDGYDSMECVSGSVERPVPYVQVTAYAPSTDTRPPSGPDWQSYTDAQGQFVIGEHVPESAQELLLASQIKTRLQGKHFEIMPWWGGYEQAHAVPGTSEYIELSHGAEVVEDTVRAQVNAYVFANQIRDWVMHHSPNISGIKNQRGVPIYTNRRDLVCPGNAWMTSGYFVTYPHLSFCKAGVYEGTVRPNTAMGSVVLHEYGHYVIMKINYSAHMDAVYGEGMSDALSVLVSGDPVIGRGWTSLGDCTSFLRTADNDCTYISSNESSCGTTKHLAGQPISGSVWDIWEALKVSHPETHEQIIAPLVLSSIALYDGDITDIPAAMLSLDDDDADLINGTPHASEICTGFEAHGIACWYLLREPEQ